MKKDIPLNEKNTLQYHSRLLVLVILVFLCSLIPLYAQEGCYNKTRSGGVSAMNNKDYDKAIKWFEQAKGCSDKPSNHDLDNLIKKCETEKKKLAENKKKAEALRRQQAEEQRIQEEREQWEREQKAEREAEMAKRAYMNIAGMKFFNEDGDDHKLSNEGEILYAKDIKYLSLNLCYTGLADQAKKATLFCKLYTPDGKLVVFKSSPDGYSFVKEVTVFPGGNNVVKLGDWGRKEGGTFVPGTYAIEIFNSEDDLLRTERVTLLEKVEVPTSASVRIKSNDSQAEIYVDDIYKGYGTCTAKLAFGSHKIECRRDHYRTMTKTINITSDSDGETLWVEGPQPIYGSLHVESKPKSAEVYVDGKSQGVTPLEIPQILVGDHILKVSKKGYNDDVKKVTIRENYTYQADVSLKRVRSDSGFASFFLDGVFGNIGNDDVMVGGQLAYCRKSVGCYGQLLYGIGHGSFAATGGVVFRLTKDYVDLQLNFGMGGGELRSYSYYYGGYRYKETFLFDAGARLGWRSKWKWSMWDIVGGCMISPDGDVCPYVGVGTALSLTAILVGSGVAYFY